MLADESWRSGHVWASSTSPGGYSASTSSVTFTSPTQFNFELLVEAAAGGEAGVVYNMSARRDSSSYYSFPGLSNVRVKPRNLQPGPTEVEFQSCMGVVQVQIGTDDTCQTPANVSSVWVSGMDGYNRQGWYTMHVPAGHSYSTRVYYSVQSSGQWVSTSLPVAWSNVGCDQIVRICKAVYVPPPPPPPPPPRLGNLTGPWEIIGEPFTFSRSIYGYTGAYYSQSLSTPRSPVSDPSTWWSFTNLLEGSHWVYTNSYVRSGRELTRLQSQIRTSVVANQTTVPTRVEGGDLRHAYVMRPAGFYGTIRLADPYVPLNPGSTSTLQSLYFGADYSNGSTSGTSISAAASGNNAYTYSWTSFRNQFDPATGELASNYDQVLPNPYDLTYSWNQQDLRLQFWSEGNNFNTRPGMYDPARFRNGNLYLYLPSNRRSAQLAPEQRFRIDHEYCFSEVQLQLRTEFGRFYNPYVDVSGVFNGTDWRGQQSAYSVNGNFYGTPYVNGYSNPQSYAQPNGSLSMALPQGTYTLRPSAQMVNSSGGVNTANFAPIQMTLGCGQRVKVVPPLAVVFNPAAFCAAGQSAPISGRVPSSGATVDRIWYRLNGGPEVTLCTNCGIDPTFSFSVNLQACNNTVQVFAFSEGLPEPATNSQQLVWDNPADGPSCPGTYCVNRPPVARCKNITLPITEAGTACGSVNDGSSDFEDGTNITCTQTPACPYAMGSHRVTLTCRDSAGLPSSCEATVTVKDGTPPTITCPANQQLECSSTGGAVASFAPVATDDRGSVSVSCNPASGSTFPLGTTTTTTCTATDAAGNRASCSFSVAVADTQPPQLTCPDPITAECTGNRSATVELPQASATDACRLEDVGTPTQTTFPVGTTSVTYGAVDSSENEATCTTTVTVRDTQAPTLTLNGDAAMTISCGDNAYTEPGATAMDTCTGDLTSQVAIAGVVDTTNPGSYTLTYTVRDAAGNTATARRTVVVLEGPGCTPTWSFTGPLEGCHAKALHQAVRLNDGRVLTVGGYNTKADLYNPSTGTWSPTGPLTVARRYHSATLLADGRVLAAGGANGRLDATTELYDPASGTWRRARSMTYSRRYHSATLLASGQVLVAGGASGSLAGSAELYDPASDTWTVVGSLSQGRSQHTATLLADGKVLVAGGVDTSGQRLASAEVYDPATRSWTPAGSMSLARRYHTATLLTSGKVLVAGGEGDRLQAATSELYDPATATWSPTGSLVQPRRFHAAALLNTGKVLVAGGYHETAGICTSAELYSPAVGTWRATTPMNQERYHHSATLLIDGRVLVIGGFSNGDQGANEVYDP